MSLEGLNKLEQKIQEVLNQSKGLSIEMNRLKEENTKLLKEKEELLQFNKQLRTEHEALKNKISSILGKLA